MSDPIVRTIISERERKGYTRYRLSKQSKVGEAQLKRIEEGDISPTTRTVLRLCRSLGIENINLEDSEIT